MKTKILSILFILSAFPGALRATTQAEISDLEERYAAEAEKLRASVEELLQDPLVREGALAETRNLHEFRKDVGQRPAPFSDGIRLAGISTRPPALKQDPNDLYWRFHSEVKLQFQRLDSEGRSISGKTIEVSVPVVARPSGEWIFPEPGLPLHLLGAKLDESALALLEVERQIAGARIRAKELQAEKAAQIARVQARRQKQKADVERSLAANPITKRRVEAVRRKYPVKGN